MSISSPNHMAQPLPPPLISKFVYAIQEEFSKHFSLHSLRFILLLTREGVASGNFIEVNLMEPSCLE
ncbi:hypothetical protein CICLE_v10010476mg [Citrus x clementina]|uniref:Uncharacterized protein n=1 Tax=Citrus clementina TaxID=85681 RepID=V4TXL3_CITCL|nr:hypothetical protein CICLE_v10010476mg [Citrus x clementina]